MPLRPGASVGRGDIPAVAMRLIGVGAGPSHGIAPGMAIAMWNNDDKEKIDITAKDMVAIYCCCPKLAPEATAINSTRREGGGEFVRRVGVSPRPLISAASSRPVLVGSAAGWASRAWLEELLGGRIGLRGCAASGSRSRPAWSYESGDVRRCCHGACKGAIREL